MTDWQPIETAPTGVDVLVFERIDRAGIVGVSRLYQDARQGWMWSGGGYGDPSPRPSHWMPLPPPPADQPTPSESLPRDQ